METQILDFLKNHRVCSLTVVLPDGTPHASALHYSHQENPLTFYFSTENTSRKCQGLLDGTPAKASVVIGFSEEEWITLQMDGEVQAILDKQKLEPIKKIHYAKHPNSQQYEHDPATIFLAFIPSWWRYTDYNTEPPTNISSQ